MKLLSGAGHGTCSLVLKLLVTPAVAYIGGTRKEFRPLNMGPRIPFWDGMSPTVRVGLPESDMLHVSASVDDVMVCIASNPSFIAPLIARLAHFFNIPSVQRICVPLSLAVCNLIRGQVLRRMPVRIELTAIDDVNDRDARTRIINVQHGMEAAAAFIASLTLYCGSRKLRRGLMLPDELVTLEEMLRLMGAFLTSEISVRSA